MDMAQNYAQGLSLNSLAEKYHFSVGYLSRMLKKETGYSFSAILNSIRLAAAVEFLMQGHMKVSLIGDTGNDGGWGNLAPSIALGIWADKPIHKGL